MRIYCDIDGTLTTAPRARWGPPNLDTIKKLKDLIKDGHQVILWSGGGSRYAKKFAKHYEIKAEVANGKPHIIIDDNPDIKPKKRMPVISPTEFLSHEFNK